MSSGASVPAPLIPRLAHYAAAPIALWRLPVIRVSGHTLSGEPGSMLIAGANATLLSLIERIMPTGRSIVALGKRSWPALLYDRQGDDDLMILRVPLMVSDLLDADPWLTMVDAVGFTVMVATLMERRQRSKSVAHNERRWRRSGFTASVTQGTADFDLFYDRMYRPFATGRFGEAALLRTRSQVHRLAERGGIVWLSDQQGQKVAAALIQVNPPCLDLVCLGTSLPVDVVRQVGVVPALYVAGAEHAQAQGLTGLRLGGTMPWLSDGILRSKVAWGAFAVSLDHVNRRNLVAWNRPSALAQAFLNSVPVLRDGRGYRAVAPATVLQPLPDVPGIPLTVIPAAATATSGDVRRAYQMAALAAPRPSAAA